MILNLQSVTAIARKRVGGGTVLGHPTLAAKIQNAYKLQTNGTDAKGGTNLSVVGTTFGGSGGELATWAIFDGINDMMFTATQLLTGNTYAIEMVIEVDSGSTSVDRTIFGQVNNNSIQFWLDNGSQTDTEFVINEDYVSGGSWSNRKKLDNGGISETTEYHIIYSRNGSAQTAYISGSAVTLATIDGSADSTNLITADRIALGCYPTGATTGVAFTAGKIKFFRVYDDNVTSGEASDLYNSGSYIPYD